MSRRQPRKSRVPAEAQDEPKTRSAKAMPNPVPRPRNWKPPVKPVVKAPPTAEKDEVIDTSNVPVKAEIRSPPSHARTVMRASSEAPREAIPAFSGFTTPLNVLETPTASPSAKSTLSDMRKSTGRKSRSAKNEQQVLEDQYRQSIADRTLAQQQWPPPTSTPAYQPVAMPRKSEEGMSKSPTEDVDNVTTLFDGSLEGKNILFQFPPLPHVKSIFVPGKNDPQSAAETNTTFGPKAGPGDSDVLMGESSAPSESSPDAAPTLFVGRGSTSLQRNSDQFLNRLPEGEFGTLRVRKSGKVEMVLGDFVFDVNPGPNMKCHGEFVHMDLQSRTYKSYGEVARRFVVTPNVQSLLAQASTS